MFAGLHRMHGGHREIGEREKNEGNIMDRFFKIR